MTISRTEQLFLQSVRAAIQQEKLSCEKILPQELEDAASLAAAQKLQPIFLDAVYSSPAVEQWAEFPQHKRRSKMQLASQMLRTSEFFSLYDSLRAAGYDVLVIKGVLCRAVYPKGELRQSADEDLYVQDADFPRLCDFLRKLGFLPTSDVKDTQAFEIGWKKPDSALYVELHRCLFSPDSGAVSDLQSFFADSFDRSCTYQIDGNFIKSLCPHDHLLYLILHAYKHFIHSGFGIRQICDIGLWAKTYADQIDWKMLHTQCQRVRADKFAAAIFEIARQQLAIALPRLEGWETVDAIPLLLDALCAGIYGSSSKSRAHSASVTFRTVEADRENRRSSILHAIFPNRRSLEDGYPILKKSAVYLPYVWCVRLWKYRKEIGDNPDSQPSEALRIAKERKNLLKQYGIIDE